jgi:hypothetical protein
MNRARPLFRSTDEFIATSYIRRSTTEVLPPRTELSRERGYAVHVLRIYYNKGLIGKKGSAWVDKRLARFKDIKPPTEKDKKITANKWVIGNEKTIKDIQRKNTG